MDLSAERLHLLAREAQQAELPLAALVDRLTEPAPPGGQPIERMLAFAAEERFTLGEELRLRDLLSQ